MKNPNKPNRPNNPNKPNRPNNPNKPNRPNNPNKPNRPNNPNKPPPPSQEKLENKIFKEIEKTPDLNKSISDFDRLSNLGLDFGRRLGQETFSEGSLGRVSEQRSSDVVDALGRMKAGLKGYTSPEYEGMREKMQQGINQNLATGLSELRRAQGIARTRGASAAAQAANLNRAALQDKAQIEQDLFLKAAQERDSRLQNYMNQIRSVEGDEFKRQAFNLGQQGQEVAGRASALTGGAGAFISGVMGQQGIQSQEQANKLAAWQNMYGNRLAKDMMEKQYSLLR
jgi:hypothetical protein